MRDVTADRTADNAVNIGLIVNGEPRQMGRSCQLDSALKSWGYREGQVAVALNGKFVPRSSYSKILLATGDQLEIVGAVEGG